MPGAGADAAIKAHPVVQLLNQLGATGFPIAGVLPWEPSPRRPRGPALLLVRDDEPEWPMARGPRCFNLPGLVPWFKQLNPGVVGVFADGYGVDAYGALGASAPAMRGGAVLIATTLSSFAEWNALAAKLAPKAVLLGWRGPPPTSPPS